MRNQTPANVVAYEWNRDVHGLISFSHSLLITGWCSASLYRLDLIATWSDSQAVRVDRWLQSRCVKVWSCISIFNNITWLNCKVVQSVEKGLQNEKHIPFFVSLACHMAKCSETQKQMSVKVIFWGHTMKKSQGVGAWVSRSIPLFSFVPDIYHH